MSLFKAKLYLKPLVIGLVVLMSLQWTSIVRAGLGNEGSGGFRATVLNHENLHEEGREGISMRLRVLQKIQTDAQKTIENVPTRGKQAAKIVSGKLHTVALLIILGGTERVGEHMSKFLKTGSAKSMGEVWNELTEIASSTAISTELWSQMMGAQATHTAQSATLKAYEVLKGALQKKDKQAATKALMDQMLRQSMIDGVVSQKMSRALFLFNHAMGYIGFFGWEAGHALYKLALEDFSKHIRRDGSAVNNIDIYRTQSVLELIKDPDLLREFLSSTAYVLGNNKQLKRVFEISYHRWTNFDLLGTYAALGAGSYVGGALGRMAIARAAGYALGEAAAARIGAATGKSRLGWFGSGIGAFIGTVIFALVKEISFFSGEMGVLTRLNRWIILTPNKHFGERDGEHALAGLRYPQFGSSMLENVKDLFGVKKFKKDLNLAKDRLNKHTEYRTQAINSHLGLMAPYMINILKYFASRSEALNPEAEFIKSYLFLSRKDGSRKEMLENVYKKYQPIADKIGKNTRLLERVEKLSAADWKEEKAHILNGLTSSKEYRDFKENLTYARYRAMVEFELKTLKADHPILMTMAEKFEKRRPLWTWLQGAENKWKPYLLQIVDSVLRKKATYFIAAKKQINHALEMLFPSSSPEVVLMTERQAHQRYWAKRNKWSDIEATIVRFKERKIDFERYHEKLADHADELVRSDWARGKYPVWNGFNNSSQVKALIFSHQKRMHAISKAFEDLFNWQEKDYLFILPKMNFILEWAAEGMNEGEFLEKYRKFRKSIDDQLLLIKRRKVAEMNAALTLYEFSIMKLKRMGAKAFMAMKVDPVQKKELQKEARAYVKENLNDAERIKFLSDCQDCFSKDAEKNNEAETKLLAAWAIKTFYRKFISETLAEVGATRYKEIKAGEPTSFYNKAMKYIQSGRQGLVTHVHLLIVEYESLKMREVGPHRYKAMKQDPMKKKKIKQEIREYVSDHKLDKARLAFFMKWHVYMLKFKGKYRDQLKSKQRHTLVDEAIKEVLSEFIIKTVDSLSPKKYKKLLSKPILRKLYFKIAFNYLRYNLKERINQKFKKQGEIELK